MSDIGYLLLFRAVLRRAELDAESNNARLRNEALAFLLEYGVPICKMLEVYMSSMRQTRERIERMTQSAMHDAAFVEATNKMFVRRAIERHGVKRLVKLSNIPREKIVKCTLNDNELKKLMTVVSELDSRLIKHASDIVRCAGMSLEIKDPWTAVEVVRAVTNGALVNGGKRGRTNNKMR